mgnify:CR=1 FL=1
MDTSHGRHELKFNINYADVIELRERLPFVVKPDEHSAPEGGYRIKSLYFDNYNDKALKEKINGTDRREKFRLRLYNNDTSFIRLEKKSKENGLCYKKSSPISEKECSQLLEGNFDVLREKDDPLCMELYAKIRCQQLRPRNIVDYRREAFVYRMGNVRITLDYDIRTSWNIFDFLGAEPAPVPVWEGYILEVKYDNFLPEIIRAIVSLSSRSCTSFSKYATARII